MSAALDPPTLLAEAEAQRNDWIRLFTRLDAAVARCVNGAEFAEDAIEQLRAAHDRILKTAAEMA